MKSKYFPLSQVSQLKIESRENGVELAIFDELATEYNMNRWMFADFVLISNTCLRLPFEAYLISATAINNTHSWGNGHLYPTGLFDHQGFFSAIKINVVGGETNENYSEGSQLKFSAGILFGSAIYNWRNWRHISEWWSIRIWEKIGFDFRKFQTRSSIRRPPVETLEFEQVIDLDNLPDGNLQVLCDFIQIGLVGLPKLHRSLRLRAREVTNEQRERAYAVAQEKSFFEIMDIAPFLPEKHKGTADQSGVLSGVRIVFEFGSCER